MTHSHIAQLNIARAKDTLDSATMKSFVDRLDEINALADQSPGFVWRLQDDDGNATAIQVFSDPLVIVNMSVWETVDHLKQFVYKTVHVELLRRRDEWFNRMPETHQVLWWVAPGTIPSIAEGRDKLALLQQQGPSKDAFTFAKLFAEKGTVVS